MKIYACDDDEKILEDIRRKALEYEPDSEINTYTSGRELLEHIENEPCDLLLLDIDMPDISGMDIAKRLNDTRCGNDGRKVLLVFVTSHDELVYESFKYHPFGFIRKHYFDEEIKKVLKDCKRELESNVRHFSFRSEGLDTRLLLSDIKYFEADSNYLKIYTKNVEYRFRSTMTAVGNALEQQGFIRIHKGFLVNQAYVKSLNSDVANLVDGTVLPMGKTYVDEAKDKLMRYMR